jgi:signal transduction histidine kinase
MKLGTQIIVVFVMTISLVMPAVYFASSTLSGLIFTLDEQIFDLGFYKISLNQDQIHAASVSSLSILASLTVFFSMYFYLQKNIVSQLNKVPQSVSHILRGKINYKMEIQGSDELEQVGKSFDLLRTSIKKKAELEHELNQSRTELENERLITIGLIAARLAHDIRNPLSVIKNTVEIMRIRFKDNMDDKVEKQLQMLTNSVIRISHQIEDVLDYVRESPLDLKEISFKELLNAILSSIKKSDMITITRPENDAILSCDPKKFEVVMVNLIVNAIQAMKDVGEIKIRLVEQKGSYLIDVEDSGPGIPEEKLDRIFEPLFTTKQTGTGLGLASVKNIIEQHGGKITVSNNPTRFTIKLPKLPKPKAT